MLEGNFWGAQHHAPEKLVPLLGSGGQIPRPLSSERHLKGARRGGSLERASYIEFKRFDLDTIRVPNRSPTPISQPNDVLGQSEDIWGVLGPISGRFWGSPGSGPA